MHYVAIHLLSFLIVAKFFVDTTWRVHASNSALVMK